MKIPSPGVSSTTYEISYCGWGGGSLTGVAYTANPSLFGGLPKLGLAKLTFSNYDQRNGGVCVDSFLDEQEKKLLANSKTNYIHQDKVSSGRWETVENKFVNPRGEPKGCLAISWDKETWRNGYWKGSIRQELVYKKGNETLVFFMLYDPEIIYYGTDLGKYMLYRTVYIDKARNKAAGFFVGQHIRSHLLNSPDGTYWGAFEKNYVKGDEPARDKLCRSAISCIPGEGEKTHREFKWTWEKHEGGKQRFVDWSSNFPTILEGYLKDELVKLNKFESLSKEKGTWTQR